jgi:hypothetical protein
VDNETKYKVSGLSHSGIKEQTTKCGDGSCNGGESCSSCSSDCGACPAAPSGGSSGGGGGGGGAVIPKQTTTDIPEETPDPIDSTSQSTSTQQVIEAQQNEVVLSANEDTIEENPNRFSSFITGAVTGVTNPTENPVISLVAIFFILVFGILIYEKVLLRKSKRSKSIFRKKYILVLIGLFLILVISSVILSVNNSQSKKLDQFANCVAEKDAVYYGSSVGCKGCPVQEKMFKTSFNSLNYVDCAKEMSKCKSNDIIVVPSWDINGEITQGALTLEKLADLTGCSY